MRSLPAAPRDPESDHDKEANMNMTQMALISQAGTLLVLLVIVTWIVLWDSRKRWPGQNAWQRLVSLFTFRRHS